jgi:PAS domain S-box-containing protein
MMTIKPSYEELEQSVRDIETETLESKRANEALRVSALAWQTLFDAVTDSVFLIDLEGKILLCNKATVNFLGKPINEIVGNTCWELVHATSEPIKGCPIVRMRETRRPESLELPVGDRVLYVATHPILDQDGNLASAVHIIADITERKRAEEELEKHRDHLEELVKERTKKLQIAIDSMTGREIRMAELKNVIEKLRAQIVEKLRAQIESEGLTPVANDPLKEIGKDYT